MEAIILAGGLGTRLRSVVSEVPKCMAPVCGKPFLYFPLKHLARFGEIDKVILSVGYLREIVAEWIRDNEGEFPFGFDFAMEDTPLGTGGAIRLALRKTEGNTVLVLNGDTFFDVNIREFHEFHLSVSALVSVALKPMREFERYGTVSIDSNRTIRSFNEKQYCKSGLISGGVYLIDKTLCSLDSMPEKFSFETDFLQQRAQDGNLYGFVEDSYFIDVGVPEDYNRANDEFKRFCNADRH
jgi:D-glycero-alpha-D-manno-heptose 1-phosphate guanylyltransferase